MKRKPQYPVVHAGAIPMGKNGARELATQCWCQRSILLVPRDVVRRGLTGSCRRPGCDQLSMLMAAA